LINATPHHIGCAVKELRDSCETYVGAFGLHRRSRPIEVASQHVQVCFIELGDCFYLELIAPLDESAKLVPYLRTGFYHLCFLVDDLAASRRQLRSQRFFALPSFESEAFAGNPCQFFVSPQSHLIELAQMSATDFGQFFESNREPLG
jgi:catechol 2,3-dioxygenase-like lactoylglutathione lyase family enzyme